MGKIKAKSYYIQTFGCQMNVAESEEMAGICEAMGLELAPSFGEASVIILNSCSVRQIAEDKVYGVGKKVKKTGLRIFGAPDIIGGSLRDPLHPLVILTGCMVGSARGDRRRIPENELSRRANFVDYFMDQVSYRDQLPKILLREGFSQSTPLNLGEVDVSISAVRREKKRAFVKISEGCDNFCTYCVVPFSRGKEISRKREDILKEISLLVDRGYEEFMLLGQNVNSWGIKGVEAKKNIRIGSDQKLPFASLLRDVHAIQGVEKISFISGNPFDFTNDMIETLALPKIDRYLHIAVQSGSDRILERMNRRHTADEFRNLVQRIRERVPDMHIGTDLIVGFCGETEEDFEETLRLVRDIKFDVAYMAMYSVRHGTLAEKRLVDDVPREVKKDRYRRLKETVESVKGQTHKR